MVVSSNVVEHLAHLINKDPAIKPTESLETALVCNAMGLLTREEEDLTPSSSPSLHTLLCGRHPRSHGGGYIGRYQ